MERRKFLELSGLSGLGVLGVSSLSFGKNKNTILEEKKMIKNKQFFIDNGQLMLQLSDRGVIKKDYLEELLHMNFKTGEMKKEYWSEESTVIIVQFLIRLHDRQFISKEVLLEKTFGEKRIK